MTASKTITALLLAATAGAAQAQLTTPVTFSYQSTAGIMEATSATPNGYLAGEMSFLTNQGLSFLGYCVEPVQDPGPVGSNQTYTLGSFTTTQSSLLQALYSSSYASVSTATQKAAFQTAVWEIVTEPTGTTLDLASGSFKFIAISNDATTNQNFSALATSYLTSALNYNGAMQYQVQKLVNANFQDYVVATPVPEPAPYAMLLAGLGAVALIARRRTR